MSTPMVFILPFKGRTEVGMGFTRLSVRVADATLLHVGGSPDF